MLNFNINTEKHEFEDVFLVFKCDTSNIITKDNEIILANNLKVSIQDEIIIEGILENETGKLFDLSLTSDDGWDININNCAIENFKSPSNKFIAKGLKFNAKKGIINEEDTIKQYKFIENLEFDTLSNTFQSNDLEGLYLHSSKTEIYPKSNGYLSFEDKYSNARIWDEKIENLYFLLKLFSSDSSNIRITYTYCEKTKFKEITIIPLSNEKVNSTSFYKSYPNNLMNFINSSYDNYINLKPNLDIKRVIHYFTAMKAEKYTETKYIMGAVFLETLKDTYGKDYKNYNQNNGGFFLKPASTNNTFSFKELLDEIFLEFDLDISKIKGYVDKKTSSSNNNILKDLVDHRNSILHQGKIPNVRNINQYIRFESIINILLLKILDIDCIIYDSILEQNINSKILVDSLKI